MGGRGVVRVREEGEGGEGEEEVGGEKLERKGRREKEGFLRILRGEDGDKGWEWGGGGVFDAYPCPPPHVC